MRDHRVRNMEEFAALSGLSRPTVSKYFNDPGSVRRSTREKIEQALERYDFRPNIYAVNQNRRSTKTLGIVVPFLADPFFSEIARTIERMCIDAGFRPILFGSHGDAGVEVENLENLRVLKPAGVLMAPLGRLSDRPTIEAFCADVPTVLFDSRIEDLGEAFVGSNNEQSIGMIVEYLCRTGDAPTFFEMRTPANPNAGKRRRAYEKAMARLGFEPRIVHAEGQGWEIEEIELPRLGEQSLGGARFTPRIPSDAPARIAVLGDERIRQSFASVEIEGRPVPLLLRIGQYRMQRLQIGVDVPENCKLHG